jgi:hypothetical protein
MAKHVFNTGHAQLKARIIDQVIFHRTHQIQIKYCMCVQYRLWCVGLKAGKTGGDAYAQLF